MNFHEVTSETQTLWGPLEARRSVRDQVAKQNEGKSLVSWAQYSVYIAGILQQRLQVCHGVFMPPCMKTCLLHITFCSV